MCDEETHLGVVEESRLGYPVVDFQVGNCELLSMTVIMIGSDYEVVVRKGLETRIDETRNFWGIGVETRSFQRSARL